MAQKKRAYFLTTTATNDRFKKYDEPTEVTFGDLFDSTGFLLEASDTATETTQGFGKLATDANAEALDSTRDTDQFAKVAQVHQLPSVVETGGNNSLTVVGASSTTGRLKGDGSAGSGLAYTIKNTLIVQNGSAALEIPFITVNQAAEGEDVTLEYDSTAFNDEVATSAIGKPGELRIYIGGTPGTATSEFATNGGGRNVGAAGSTSTGSWIGWEVADGAPGLVSGTRVNLKRQTLVGWDTSGGVDYDTTLALHGAAAVTLTAAQSGVPAHNHEAGTLSTTNSGAHTHDIREIQGVGTGANAWEYNQGTLGGNPLVDMKGDEGGPADGTHSHDVTGDVADNVPENAETSHENRPPSAVVIYVYYTGAAGQNT